VDPRLTTALAGRYRIERELGRGGMATVFLARDLRHDREVAIKVMHPELALGRERFLREIGMAAGLTHPHIVALYDSGDADGLLYYVMPYVAGRTLRDRMAGGPAFTIDEVVRLASHVADALGTAHQRGVIHRDVKPENILITAGGHALVADFGVAMAMQQPGDQRLTRTGVSVGTPAYMSPEQLFAADVDARSDVWALGCVMFEMLTGRPIGRSAASAASAAQQPVAAELRRLRPDTPEELVQVVQRALTPDADTRFPSARELAAALGARPALPASVPGSARRRLPLVLGAIAVAIAGVTWIALPTAAGRNPPRDPEVLALYSRGAREFERRTPEGAAEAIRAFKAALDKDSTFAPAWIGLSNVYTRTIVRQWLYPGALSDSLLRLAVAAAHRALTLDSLDPRAWAARAEVSRHVDPTEMGVPLRAARKAIALDSSSAVAWFMLGISLADSGDLDAGIDAWRQGARRNPTYNQGLAFLALGLFWRKQYDSAATWADSAVTVDPSYFLARHTLGLIEIERGNFARAISALESARRLTTGPDVVVALAGRVLAEARAGDRERARRTLRAADSLGRMYSPAPLHVAVYVAMAHGLLGDTRRAIEWLDRYPVRRDRHFQLHVQCEPGFAPLARDSGFRAVSSTSSRISGC
jgi:tetratricopeptide (TPR) repeat protein